MISRRYTAYRSEASTHLGFRPDSDVAMWWIADSADAIQAMLADLDRSSLGSMLTQSWAFLGVRRPPEVAKEHVPSFMEGAAPKKYIVIYPFVRTAEWYLMPKKHRADLLREHGNMGREFPGILANTTSGFALGDWEWILAFEADELTDLVDCMRRLRRRGGAPVHQRRHTVHHRDQR